MTACDLGIMFALLQVFLTIAEGEGFEPSMDEKTPITVFETTAFNHSATPPDGGPERLAEDHRVASRVLVRAERRGNTSGTTMDRDSFGRRGP